MMNYIRLLHRHDQGISLTQSLKEGYREHGTTQDEKDISRLLEENRIDLYMTIHGINYDYFEKTKFHQNTTLKKIRRQIPNVQYLNCCYADLDVGRLGTVSLLEAKKTILELEHKGIIPKASIKVYSGQGMWLLWLLGDSKSSIRAVVSNRELFKRIQRHLSGIFLENGLSPDKGAATDLVKVFRVPSSTNSKNSSTVHWEIQGDHNGTYFYRLNEFKSLVSLPETSWKEQKRETINKGSVPKRARGPEAVAKYRALDLIAISKHFKIKKGKRRNHLTFLSWFMFDAGYKKKEIKKQLLTLSKSYCMPVYPSDSNDVPVKAIIEDTEKNKMNKTFSNHLLSKMFFDCHFDKAHGYNEKKKVANLLKLRSITSIKLPKQSSKKQLDIKERIHFVDLAMKNDPEITVKNVQLYLKLEGHDVDLRTVQRTMKCSRQK